ncbi:MAG: LolA-related protein [Burkholderiaceae bacterium]
MSRPISPRGAVRTRRRLLGLGLAGPWLARAAIAVDDWSIADLFAALARQPASRARFIEFRRISELEGLLESSGELEFEAPDRLVKRTLRPLPEELLLEGDQLTVRQGRFEQRLPMSDLPGVGELAAGLRAMLLGDLAALQAHFELALTGKRGNWQLQALPRDPDAAAVLARLVIAGQQARIDEVRVELVNGDLSTMRILPL